MVVLDSVSLLLKTSSVHSSEGDVKDDAITPTKATHLHLEKSVITEIGEIGVCPRLRVLYLFNNQIQQLKNLDFCYNLTHLYLQNNKITRIQNMHQLPVLQKLFLSCNHISVLEGLEANYYLEELHLDHQNMPEGIKLIVDPRTVTTLKRSLGILDVSSSSLTSLKDLTGLSSLVTLTAKNNKLSDMEDLLTCLECLTSLEELTLTGNPVTQTRRYREKATMASPQLELLDGKDVKKNSREFLLRMRDARSLSSYQSKVRDDLNPYESSSEAVRGHMYPFGVVSGIKLQSFTELPVLASKSGSVELRESKCVLPAMDTKNLSRKIPSCMFTQQVQFLKRLDAERNLMRGDELAKHSAGKKEEYNRYKTTLPGSSNEFTVTDTSSSSGFRLSVGAGVHSEDNIRRNAIDDTFFPAGHIDDISRFGMHG